MSKQRKQERAGNIYQNFRSASPVLSPPQALVHFILTTTPLGRFCFKPIFQMRKLRLSEEKLFFPGPTARKGQGCTENQARVPPKPGLHAGSIQPTHAANRSQAPTMNQLVECELRDVRLSTFVREIVYPHFYMKSVVLQCLLPNQNFRKHCAVKKKYI